MHMIVFPVALQKLRFKIPAYLGKEGPQGEKHFLCQNTSTVFRDKDQMHTKIRYAISSMSDFLDFSHRPSIIKT